MSLFRKAAHIALIPVFGILLSAAQPTQIGPWQQVIEGIDYQEVVLPGNTNAYVARMDRSNPNLILDTGIAQGSITGGMEVVSNIAERYDGSLSTWPEEWGASGDVVVAVNGFFYDTETGLPENGLIHSGWYVKRFNDNGNSSGLTYTVNRDLWVGGCVYHELESQIVYYYHSRQQQYIDAINVDWRGNNLIVYTPQYGSHTPVRSDGVEMVVELYRPMTIIPWPYVVGGRIVSIERNSDGHTPIPFDHIVIQAGSAHASNLLEYASVGSEIGISMEIEHRTENCGAPNPNEYISPFASVSNSWVFLDNGRVRAHNDNLGAATQHPRTAVCYNEDYIYFVVVEGRLPGESEGVVIETLGYFCRDELDADWGVALDGGGSSTMWVDGEVMNSPSDGHERPVADSLMMIAVQPPEMSNSYAIGDIVSVSEPLNIRNGPGLNHPIIGTIDPNVELRVLPQHNDLNGIEASGSFWWYVEIFGLRGWVAEDGLIGGIDFTPESVRESLPQGLMLELLEAMEAWFAQDS